MIAPKALDRVTKVTDAQIAFARRLGIDCCTCTIRVAHAMIEDAIQRDFWADPNTGSPSPKQVELASKFGFDIVCASRRVGNALIDDIMLQLNMEAVADQGLAAGVFVYHRRERWLRPSAISSITSDGLVYLKGGQGRRAWARNLVRDSHVSGRGPMPQC